MKILFTGGGTGGHIFPIVAVAREMRRISSEKDLKFFYIGPKNEFGAILFSQEEIKVKNILAGKIRRYFSLQNFIDIFFKIPLGIIQSFFLLLKIKPRLIFSKGGYGSIPVTFCARILRIPVPGLSNRVSSKWAKKIFVSFPGTEYFDLRKVVVVGNPIRKELLEGSKEKAKELFGITFKKPVILFSGGSQGAEKINDFVLRILNKFLKDFEIIHQCGRENFKDVEAQAQIVIEQGFEKYYHPFPFLGEEKLKHVYKAADFVISRAGAGGIFEISALGKPSILVPLSSAAADHQAKNAYAYAESGACVVIEEKNLTPNFFSAKLHYLFSHPEELENMRNQALRFSKPLAAKAIARHILEYFMLE